MLGDPELGGTGTPTLDEEKASTDVDCSPLRNHRTMLQNRMELRVLEWPQGPILHYA